MCDDEIKPDKNATRLRSAILRNDIERIRTICKEHPGLISGHMVDFTDRSWLCDAAETGDLECVRVLLELGFDIDASNQPENSTAITIAIDEECSEIVEELLRRGANPNIGRPIIAAINCNDSKLALRFVRLLVEHGCDVNKLHDLYGDKNKAFTALDWADDRDIVLYLKSVGAKSSKEIRADLESVPPDEVVQYFENTYGSVNQKAIIEIVPSGPTVAVHVVPAVDKRNTIILFTSGLSKYKMRTPIGKEDYQFGELFIELPGDWKYKEISKKRWAWPALWLRKLAHYPINAETWLGGPLSIIANGEPPEPLAAGLKFTSVMLLAEKSFKKEDGAKVQLFRMTPLYTEERELELKRGMKALIQAFDRANIPFVFDLDRKSVVPK